MSKPKVTYFNLKALGESIRMLLAYGGQEFDDIRVEKDEDWPELKPKTKFGQLPILEMDGKVMAQSASISRYLGRKYGIAGDNDEESFEIDEIVDFLVDIREHAKSIFWETDTERRAKLKEEKWRDVFPQKLGKLHEILQKNNGHVALGKLTWGDFFFAGQYDVYKKMLEDPDLSKKYPAFQQVVDNVLTLPKIKKYLESSPSAKCDF